MNIEKRYIYDYLKCLYYSRSSTVSNVKYVGVFHYIFVLFNIPLTCFIVPMLRKGNHLQWLPASRQDFILLNLLVCVRYVKFEIYIVPKTINRINYYS